MNTEKINFRLTATAYNVNVYKANFAGCEIELDEDKQSLQLIDDSGDHETWIRDEHGVWVFVEGQWPTQCWSDDYHTSLEAAIEAL